MARITESQKEDEKEDDNLLGDLRGLDDDKLWDLAEKFANDRIDNYFNEMWNKEKNELKPLSKKELAEELFFRGSAESFFIFVKNMQQFQIENPIEDESIWKEGGFAKKIEPEEMDAKMRTFSMEHDEEMNFNCKLCKVKISAHNNDWHEGLCDKCFDIKFNDGELHIEDN